MPPKNRNKLGLTIPVDPRCRGMEAFYGNNAISSPSSSPAPLPSPSRRTIARSPRPNRPIPAPPPAPVKKTVTAEEEAELESLVSGKSTNKRLTKQLSMSEKTRDVAWERRKRQVQRRERRRNSISGVADIAPSQAADGGRLTDADWHELKGSIELGFGFNEEGGQRLSNTLPALDLYFAVNRRVLPSPVSTPQATSPDGPQTDDSWRICSPGDDPQQVKTKLRHWAQAVACSVMQTF